jgi:hypothetical protein
MHVACHYSQLGVMCIWNPTAYSDFNGKLAMRAELQRPVAELVDNLQFLARTQAIHLGEIAAPIRQRGVCATPILDARAEAVAFGLCEALGALARDVGFDALGGLDVGFEALQG